MPTQTEIRIKSIQRQIKVNPTGIFDLDTCKKFESIAGINPPAGNDLIVHKEAIQRFLGFTGLDIDGLVGVNTLTRIENFLSPSMPPLPAGTNMKVSINSLELIIEEEVSSRAAYNKKYKFPIWPGGESGITIGIGYDIGVIRNVQFTADWKHRMNPATFSALSAVVGLTGTKAKNALSQSIKSLIIPLDHALDVFYTISMPKYAKDVKRIYPGVEKLPPDAQGALLSLVYNRGPALTGKDDRRKEMKNIVKWVASGNLAKIAGEIRSMKRLWVNANLPGLLKRRDREADLVANANFFIRPEDCISV